MPKREVLHRKHKKVPIGDLRTRVKVFTVNLVSNPDGTSRSIEVLEKFIWCKVETISDRDLRVVNVNILNANVIDPSTHIFTCRASVTINGERLLGIGLERYRVTSVEPVQEAGEYLQIKAESLGQVTQGAATG